MDEPRKNPDDPLIKGVIDALKQRDELCKDIGLMAMALWHRGHSWRSQAARYAAAGVSINHATLIRWARQFAGPNEAPGLKDDGAEVEEP